MVIVGKMIFKDPKVGYSDKKTLEVLKSVFGDNLIKILMVLPGEAHILVAN